MRAASAPSPTPPVASYDARLAVVAAPRAARGSSQAPDFARTAEALLASPAFVAAVKRAMAAAGFPVEVALVGVSAEGSKGGGGGGGAARAPAAAPRPRQPTPVAAAGVAGSSAKRSPGAIAGACVGVAAAAAVAAAVAGLALGKQRRVRDRLPSSADGAPATKQRHPDPMAAAIVMATNDAFHDAASEAAGSDASSRATDAGTRALAANPAVARVLATARAAAADRAAAMAGVGVPAPGAVVGSRFAVGERLGRRVAAGRDAAGSAVVLKVYAPDDPAAGELASLVRGGGRRAPPLAGTVAPLADLPPTKENPYRVLVFPRGQFLLHDWLAGARSRGGGRAASARYTAAAVATRLASLHAARVAHRVLDPRRFVWMGEDWKLVLTGAAAVVGSTGGGPRATAAVGPLRYAPPEAVAALAAGGPPPAPTLAGDAWSLGAVLYEVFAGRPLFPARARDAAVAGALLGLAPLPTEVPPTLGRTLNDAWGAVRDPGARALLQGLLVREPHARLTLADVVASPALQAVDT